MAVCGKYVGQCEGRDVAVRQCFSVRAVCWSVLGQCVGKCKGSLWDSVRVVCEGNVKEVCGAM